MQDDYAEFGITSDVPTVEDVHRILRHVLAEREWLIELGAQIQIDAAWGRRGQRPLRQLRWYRSPVHAVGLYDVPSIVLNQGKCTYRVTVHRDGLGGKRHGEGTEKSWGTLRWMFSCRLVNRTYTCSSRDARAVLSRVVHQVDPLRVLAAGGVV